MYEQINNIQNFALMCAVDRSDNVQLEFSLTDEIATDETCLFPKTNQTISGIKKGISSRLIWRNQDAQIVLEDTLEEKDKTVYNIPKVDCSIRNEFQLYITVEGDPDPVEQFVAQGIVYISMR